MSKPKLLLIGYRAFGDWAYTVPVLPYLFDKYDVHLEVNLKGYGLFHNDPRFIGKTVFHFEKYPVEDHHRLSEERWKHLEETLKPDKVINLWRTLETECIAERYQEIFHKPVADRQAHFGGKNFYEAIFERCEIPMPEELDTTGFYYDEAEIAWAEQWREEHRDDFLVMLPISGSCMHKVYMDLPRLANDILDLYPNAMLYFTGDDEGFTLPKNRRIRNAIGKAPIKQIFLMTKYADLVIGGETGTLVAAGMWGTPKIMFCTASSVYQTCKYHKNDFSMQAPVACSPCHRSIYAYSDCENIIEEGPYKYPACISAQPFEEVFKTVDEIYHRDLRQSLCRQVSRSC